MWNGSSLNLPKGSIVVLDRGYVDFARLYKLAQRHCDFVVRARDDLSFRCIQAHPTDIKAGVYSDQTILLAGGRSKKGYPAPLRRVRFYDAVSCLELVFLTNRLDLSALTIAAIYKQRLSRAVIQVAQAELERQAFLWQFLNAVKSQIGIAVCTYSWP